MRFEKKSFHPTLVWSYEPLLIAVRRPGGTGFGPKPLLESKASGSVLLSPHFIRAGYGDIQATVGIGRQFSEGDRNKLTSCVLRTRIRSDSFQAIAGPPGQPRARASCSRCEHPARDSKKRRPQQGSATERRSGPVCGGISDQTSASLIGAPLYSIGIGQRNALPRDHGEVKITDDRRVVRQ